MPSKIRRAGSFVVVGKAVVMDERLKAIDKAVFLSLISFSGGWDRENTFPGRNAIARRAGCSLESVKRSLKLLEELGYLKIVHRVSGKVNLSNMYEITLMEWGSDSLGAGSEGAEEGSDRADPTGSERAATNYQSLYQETETNEGPSATPETQGQKVKKLVALYYDLYKEKTGRKMTADGGRVAGTIQRWMKTYSDEDLEKIFRWFFAYEKRAKFGFSTLSQRFDDLAPIAVQAVKVNGGTLSAWLKADYEKQQAKAHE